MVPIRGVFQPYLLFWKTCYVARFLFPIAGWTPTDPDPSISRILASAQVPVWPRDRMPPRLLASMPQPAGYRQGHSGWTRASTTCPTHSQLGDLCHAPPWSSHLTSQFTRRVHLPLEHSSLSGKKACTYTLFGFREVELDRLANAHTVPRGLFPPCMGHCCKVGTVPGLPVQH